MYTIIGSNSKTSINQQVALKIAKQIDLNIIDVNESEIPMYSPQIEEAGFPSEIVRIYDKIVSGSKLIIFTPEYNGHTTPYFKNIFDWLSRVDHHFLTGIDVKIITVTPGTQGGASVRKILSESLPYFGADSVETYGIGDYYNKVEADALDADVQNVVKLINKP